MPIPQLSKKTSSPQNWRNKRKKYYLSQSGPGGSYKKNKKNSLVKRLTKKLLVFFVIFIVFSALFGLVTVAWISRKLPDPNRLIDRQVAQSTKIYDRTGETILYEIHGAEKRTLVNLDDIPQFLKDATIAIEDKDFYKHGGFSFWAMFRTAITNILRGQKAGGSTLTQQLIKNAILSPEKTYTRKVKELLVAYKVEKKFSKDEILQMYLNEIPYGSTSYGVESASQRYFNKHVQEISIAEAAILAALPQAPSRYSPYGSNKDLLIARQHYILDLMVEQSHITEEEAEIAKLDELEFKEQSNNIIAPHFVMYVRELLAEKYGDKMIEQDGLKIYTTLDLYKQKIAEEVIAEIGPKNEAKYQATNAALISLDPKTGQVLAMVGSRDYFNDEIDGQVNVALQPRQPGSSFKPMVYATALSRGYTPDTVLYDIVTNFSHDTNKPYEPHNYNNQEHGPVTIRKALAGSLNIPAVKAIYLAGIDNVLDLADTLGYSTLKDRSRFGLSLVLGGGEVKLIEHVNAYSAFAREGILTPPSLILKIEDKDGKVIEEYNKDAKKEKKVLDGEIARQINNILSDNAARAYAFGETNWLTLGTRPVAAKTGTTNDYRDAWTIGYTPSIVTGVWVGNNDNAEMKRGAAGGTVAAPIWHDFMKRVLGDTPVEYFKEPKKIVTGKPILDGKINGEIKIKIDKASGLLASEYTPISFIEEKIFSEHHSILYYLNKDDPRGDPPTSPNQDPQFELWEKRVLNWVSKQSFSSSTPPTEYDNLHKPENRPVFLIDAPANNQAIMEPLLNVNINASAPRGINRVEYYVNDRLLAATYSYPFNLNQQINSFNNGLHQLSVKVCDDIDNCSTKSLEFNLILDDEDRSKRTGLFWQEPNNGLAITSIDFPITLKIDVVGLGIIDRVAFYYLASDNSQQQIGSLQPDNAGPVSIQWNNAPPSGTYRLYAEAGGQNKPPTKSEDIIITVTNLDKLNNENE